MEMEFEWSSRVPSEKLSSFKVSGSQQMIAKNEYLGQIYFDKTTVQNNCGT